MSSMLGVVPVFFRAPAERLDGLEVCCAAEKVMGEGSVHGAQPIGKLWRLYVRSSEARVSLMSKGLTVQGVKVDLRSRNPFLMRDGDGNGVPSTKMYIGDVPCSFANEEIEKALNKAGVKRLSALTDERYRNKDGQLTNFVTGRRMCWAEVPAVSLPVRMEMGVFKASIFYREQTRNHFCFRCRASGHRAAECPQQPKCWSCGEVGHEKAVCTRGVSREQAAGRERTERVEEVGGGVAALEEEKTGDGRRSEEEEEEEMGEDTESEGDEVSEDGEEPTEVEEEVGERSEETVETEDVGEKEKKTIGEDRRRKEPVATEQSDAEKSKVEGERVGGKGVRGGGHDGQKRRLAQERGREGGLSDEKGEGEKTESGEEESPRKKTLEKTKVKGGSGAPTRKDRKKEVQSVTDREEAGGGREEARGERVERGRALLRKTKNRGEQTLDDFLKRSASRRRRDSEGEEEGDSGSKKVCI